MEPGIILLKILAVIALVLLNGFFVAAEFALVKIRGTQLDALIARGHRRARVARGIVDNLDAALSATQLGITLASLGLGWIGEPVFADLLAPLMSWLDIESERARHSISFAIGFSVITFLHIVAGELAPKSLAIRKSLPTSLWVAQPLIWFYRLSYPAIWALNHAANWLLRRFGIEPVSEAELVHSAEELKLLVSTAHQHSGATKLGRDIVLNALDLRRRVARDVMRPRQEVVAFDADMTLAECMDVAEKTRYSRFPLVENNDLDRTLGVVHIKDLYAARLKARTARDLASLAKKLVFVPETARLERLLQLFLERRLQFAMVVDEYGGTQGIVTLENILEELVGQIQDEFDQEQPRVVKVDAHTWSIDGLLPLHELGELVHQELLGEGVTTAGGWVTLRLGGVAKPGDMIPLGSYELVVEQMDGLRISRLKLVRKPDATAAAT